MFSAVRNRYRADPDLVLGSGTAVLAVGDVKHKQWTGNADESDVYQLLAHTAAYRARDCFLIYSHTEFAARSLGKNPLGGTTTLFAVDVRDLPESIGRVALELGLNAKIAAA
jgi:5-methylcytosine-specific restriction endonuclease McrBC regulatory subunit McrC